MFCRATCNIIRRSVDKNVRVMYILQNPSIHNFPQYVSHLSNLQLPKEPNLMMVKRYKHRKSKTIKHKEENEDESEDEDEEEIEVDEYMKSKSHVVESKMNSLRLDSITKTGLKISRRKVEELFYDSKIRVNGNKVYKKSSQVGVGDEIDVIIEQSVENPNHIIVNRLILVSATAVDDGFRVKMHRIKSLLIEDYGK